MGQNFQGEPIIRQILELLEVCELSRSQIMAQLGLTQKKAERMLDVMKSRGLIQNIGHMHNSRWVLAKNLPKPAEPQETVRLPDRAEWLMPTATTEVVDGVTITRQGAPKGRFHVDIPRGTGAISQDWKARRREEVQQ